MFNSGRPPDWRRLMQTLDPAGKKKETTMYEPTMTLEDLERKKSQKPRLLSTIAKDVKRHWRNKDGGDAVNYAARPYLNAMATMRDVSDACGAETGRDMVAYFLANAATWRGEAARAVKAELNVMLKKA